MSIFSFFSDEVGIVVAITSLLLLLTVFITLFLLIQQQRYHRYRRERDALKFHYENELNRSQLEMQEQTLRTVGRELHDNLGQVLSLVKITLNTLPTLRDDNSIRKLDQTKDLLNQAIADLRSLSRSLNVENRLGAGLAAAIGHELDAVRKTGVVETTLDLRGTEQRLDPRQELIVFRIVQETLNNALKHAEAKNIVVSLDYSVGALNLTVADDGVGFDLERVVTPSGGERGSGLTNIQNRARLIGAEASIRSAADHGTTTFLSIPLPHPNP